MSAYTQILYQIVFSTKYREATLVKDQRHELFKCIWGILNEKKCHLYQINGVEDHIHIITSIHPTIALANLIKDIKLGTSCMIKEKNLFKDFRGWQVGYSAFTYTIQAKSNLVNYVKNQEEHHQRRSYVEELKGLLQEHGIEYDEKYLE